MTESLLALVYGLFIWWFGTGALLLVDRVSSRTRLWTALLASALAAAGVVGIALTHGQASVVGAYVGFTGAVAVWAWLELSYLQFGLTGPRKLACPPGLTGWPRFWLALQTSLYHELLVAGTGVIAIVALHDAANPFALWTYVVLWLMRWSAKLNVYFGVSNLNVDWLPSHLQHTASYMGTRRINALFPVSVSVATLIAAMILWAAWQPELAAPERVGLSLVAAMLVLGVLEHWFLVLPLDDAALWRWARPRTPPTPAGDAAR